MVVSINQIEAVGYIRQSDERQDKEDISEQTQLRKIEAFCDFNGFKLVKVFKDIDYSGFRIKYTKRPGLMEGLEYVKNRPTVKKFVFFNLSRLTRLRKDFHSIHETLKTYEVDICSASEAVDFSTANGRFVAGILVDMNEYYSDSLSDTMIETKRTNAEKGRWNGGPLPYGIVKVNGIIQEDGFKAEAIKECFRMAKSGKGPFICAGWMNDQGYLTETGVKWTPRRMRYVLTNPTYAAMQRWDGELYPLLNFPKLVDKEDFFYIQSTLFGNEKAWKGKERQLLTTVLKCPICGGKMHSRKVHTSDERRYVCSNKNMPGGCGSITVDLSTLNNSVVETITSMARTRYTKEQVATKLVDDQENNLTSMQRLKNEYDRLEQAKQKVFDDYYLDAKLTEQQFNLLTKRYQDRQVEISVLLEKIPIPKKNKYGDFDEIVSMFGEAINELPDQDLRKLVELLVEEITPASPAVIRFRWGEEKVLPVKQTIKYKAPVYYY